MQCPSCQFRNMPGVETCGRCGGNLRVDTMELDVHPPRASNRNFWQRNFPSFSLQSGNRWNRFWEFLTQTRISIFGNWDIPDVDPGPVLRRLIVPGWPQIYCGSVRRGMIFLGVYLASIMIGLLLIGSFWGNQILGLSIGCHVSSVLDVALMGERNLFNRMKRAVSWTFLLLLLVYLPAGMLFVQVVSPNVIQAAMPPFQQGDILLVNQLSVPRTGDVVLYNIRTISFDARMYLGNADVLQIQGPRIDRILAGPGQEVITRDGALLIDGVPSQYLPCNKDRTLPRLKVTVPSNSFLILPSSDLNIPNELMDQVAVVSFEQITGRVYFRNQPFSRFGFIH